MKRGPDADLPPRMLRGRLRRGAAIAVLGLALLFGLPSAHAAGPLRRPATYEDIRVRVAIVREAHHIAVGATEVYTIRGAGGTTLGQLRARYPYFFDLVEGGTVLMRDAAGKEIARARGGLLLEPAPGANAAIYIQTVRNVKAWRAAAMNNAASYRGSMRIAVASDGLLAAVNELPLEHYLYGVVAVEIGDFAPAEALKAQAIAGRSEAFTKMRRRSLSRDPLYDFTDSSPQVYRGWREEGLEVRKAVDATRGMILTWHGQPVDAVYGHSCGGVVAEVSEIWGGAPLAYSRRRWDRAGSSKSVDLTDWQSAEEVTGSEGTESFCSPNQEGFPKYAQNHFRWRRAFSAGELTQLIDPSYRTGRVRDLVVDKRSPSGRVQRLRVVGERRTVILDRELRIRGALGSLKSTFFTFTIDRDANGRLDRVYIHGAGYGHGAGMCQMGAFMMAKRGYDYRAILSHYFSGVSLQQLYP